MPKPSGPGSASCTASHASHERDPPIPPRRPGRPVRHLHPDDLTDYPAHLHIALAPQAQGKGAGRALMDTYLEALRSAEVPSVHLSMSASNTGARAFYDRLGFHQIARLTPTRVLLGRRTHPLPPW